MQHRSTAVVGIFVGCMLAAVTMYVSAQQPYPSKPIRVIIPVVPGGAADNVSRIFADKLKDQVGQPVIAENRPGANEMIAMDFVARAAPDGHTLLVQSGTHVIFPFVEPNATLQPQKTFAPVAPLTRVRFTIVVHPSLPVKTLKDFIAFAKARPGQILFASAGTNTSSRLSGEVFNVAAGVKMQNIAYKGAGQSLTDLMGGQVHVAFYSPGVVATIVKAGRLRALAISGEGHLPLMADVPTFVEAGLPAYNEFGWQGVFVAVATPKPIIDRLSNEIARMQSAPDLKNQYERQGLETFVMTTEQFAAFINAESAKLDKVIKTANIKFTAQ